MDKKNTGSLISNEVDRSPKKTFYITTPIYYVNAIPHLGHAYSTICADTLNRYHRMFGEDTFFSTGTDEHGQKVAEAARKSSCSPQEHVNKLANVFKKTWESLYIEPSIFIRTTDDFHVKVVHNCLQKLFNSGDIYTKEFEGWYCISEEIFYPEKELVDGKTPSGKEVEKVRETNYFFKMSRFQNTLIEHIKNYPSFIIPESRRNEVMGFLSRPLEDLCISRPRKRVNWGIDLPFDNDFVTYVWFDALLNYISAIGYDNPLKSSHFSNYWSSATHLIGKDILITHAVYWPTILLALGLPLPKQIVAHGWWLNTGGDKMSKSAGVVVNPLDLKDIVGVDAFRYFLVKGMRLGNDAQFDLNRLVVLINTDLADKLGNLLGRTSKLIEQYFSSTIPTAEAKSPETLQIIETAKTTTEQVLYHIEHLSPDRAIEVVIDFVSLLNKYFSDQAPWKTVKEDLKTTAETLYTCLEGMRLVGILLFPVMPSKCKELLQRLGWNGELSLANSTTWGELKAGNPISFGPPLFPRVRIDGH